MTPFNLLNYGDFNPHFTMRLRFRDAEGLAWCCSVVCVMSPTPMSALFLLHILVTMRCESWNRDARREWVFQTCWPVPQIWKCGPEESVQ